MSNEEKKQSKIVIHGSHIPTPSGTGVIHGSRTSKYPQDVAIFHDLREGCEEGYYLIEVIYDEEVVAVPSNVVVPLEAGGTYCTVCSNTHGQPPAATYANPTAHAVGGVARRPRFLMGRDEASSIKAWKTKLVNAHKAEMDLRTNFAKLRKEYETATAETARTQRSLKTAEEELKELSSAFAAEQQVSHKIERDIAAIRKSIGDAKMQEILEADRG
jgi:hypothetical protein